MDSVYDQALSEVGQDGNFQKKFDLVYNVVLEALWSMAYMSIILALVVIPHNCKVPQKPTNISDYDWKLKNIPSSNISGEIIFNSCSVYINPADGSQTKECNEYNYDTTWYKSTVSSENNWVCDKELYVANVFAYSRIGEMVGSIFFGWFGDIYGRRLTYIISLALIVFGRTLSILAGHSYTLFVIGCVLACLPSWSVSQSTTVISIEISSPKRRTTTASLRFAAFSFGVCIMALLYWWLKEWKIFLIVTTATQLPFLFLSWNIIESPRWLWIEGKPEACIKQLKRIAKANNTKLNTDTEKDILMTAAPLTNTARLGPLELFSAWNLAIITSLQLCLWVCVTLSYTVLLMSSGEKSDGNPFLEFGWQAAVEVPGNLIGGWLADHIGRRYTGVLSFAVTAITWTLIAFRETSTNPWYHCWWVGTAIITVSRFSTTVSYYTINLFNMELYPTCLRQSGMSLGNVFSSGASAIAPYMMYIGRNFGSRVLGVVLTGVSIVGVISSFFLPETLNAKLPETIEDAREFGRNNDKRYFSILMRNSSTDQNNESKIQIPSTN